MARGFLTSHPARLVVAVTAVAALLAAGSLALFESGPADAARVRVLGPLKGGAKNKCGSPKNCRSVIASVTGYQATLDGKRGPMKAPSDGHIVAIGMDLGKPDKAAQRRLARSFSGGPYDGKPTAQAAILRKQSKARVKLIRKGKDVNVKRFLGERPTVAFKQPLRIEKGDVVGLTTPSWLPTLGADRDSIWRASQNPDNPRMCGKAKFLERRSEPQRKVNSTRRYRCAYRPERLLYWAYFVPKRSGDGGGGNGGPNAAQGRMRVLGDEPADLPSGGVRP